jgi:predicted NUDIX family NTP pyrophosphohydrolase
MFRTTGNEPEVFLVHPGGPFWARKDLGFWTIPKGEPMPQEELLIAAQREFTEETSFPSSGPFYDLGSIRQAGGKVVTAWAFEGDCDPAQLKSNLCQIEWPPRSKRMQAVPEVDRGAWFTLPGARPYLLESQHAYLERLEEILKDLTSSRPNVQR